MIKLYHIIGPYDDPYDYYTLDPQDVRNRKSWETLDILEINSLYHFFECCDFETIENGREIFRQLLGYWYDGKIESV